MKTGAGEARLLVAFNNGGLANNGLIQVLEGTLASYGTVTQSGDVEVAAGARFAPLFGTFTADAQWTETGPWRFATTRRTAHGSRMTARSTSPTANSTISFGAPASTRSTP